MHGLVRGWRDTGTVGLSGSSFTLFNVYYDVSGHCFNKLMMMMMMILRIHPQKRQPSKVQNTQEQHSSD